MAADSVSTQPAVLDNLSELRAAVSWARQRGMSVGFVPTMGALHAGHASLIAAARKDCGFVVLSVFVNPTQFGPSEDYHRYPKTLDRDLEIAAASGADVIFHPAVEVMYPATAATMIDPGPIGGIWEGAIRPGHFKGVATVVLKLFAAVEPDIAYFGQKDFQQQVIIRRVCKDLLQDVQIRTCPTIRDPDGLAMSSRNSYLNPAERDAGLGLSRAVFAAKTMVAAGERDVGVIRFKMHELLSGNPLVRVDYATLVDPITLQEVPRIQAEMVAIVAARVGNTRLIDNETITAALR